MPTSREITGVAIANLKKELDKKIEDLGKTRQHDYASGFRTRSRDKMPASQRERLLQENQKAMRLFAGELETWINQQLTNVNLSSASDIDMFCKLLDGYLPTLRSKFTRIYKDSPKSVDLNAEWSSFIKFFQRLREETKRQLLEEIKTPSNEHMTIDLSQQIPIKLTKETVVVDTQKRDKAGKQEIAEKEEISNTQEVISGKLATTPPEISEPTERIQKIKELETRYARLEADLLEGMQIWEEAERKANDAQLAVESLRSVNHELRDKIAILETGEIREAGKDDSRIVETFINARRQTVEEKLRVIKEQIEELERFSVWLLEEIMILGDEKEDLELKEAPLRKMVAYHYADDPKIKEFEDITQRLERINVQIAQKEEIRKKLNVLLEKTKPTQRKLEQHLWAIDLVSAQLNEIVVEATDGARQISGMLSKINSDAGIELSENNVSGTVESDDLSEGNQDNFKERIRDIPYIVEFSQREAKTVKTQFESVIMKLLEIGEDELRQELTAGQLRSDQEMIYYQKMIDQIIDGTFLDRVKKAIVILGALRDDSDFVARDTIQIRNAVMSREAKLFKVEFSRERSLKATEIANGVYQQLHVLNKIKPELSLLEKIDSRGSGDKAYVLTELGKIASQVWTKELIDAGIISADQLHALYDEVN